jgi:ADP-ribosyltransferase exoenzyme
MKAAHKVKTTVSKSAGLAKIKWDEKKHKREAGGRFTFKPGTEEFKAEPFGAGKTSGVVDTDVIKLHVKANPKKPGSAASADFAKYEDNMTVGEFKAAVGPNAKSHLTHDTGKGFITIHDPKTLPPVEKELAFSDYVITSKVKGVVPTDKIKLLSTSNPKKPGSKAAEDFAKYKDEMTVAEFHAAVGDKSTGQGHILHDLKKGYISVHDPADLKALKTGAKSPGLVAAEQKIGDKKLGVFTTNPFTAGTKNHEDFEAAAKSLGLQTPAAAGAANKAAIEGKKKFSDLADDDTVVMQSGTEYKVKDLKASMSAAGAAKYDQNVESGIWKVKKAQKASHGLAEDDVIESYLGSKYTVSEWKKHMQGSGQGDLDAFLTKKLNDGGLKVVPKVGATTTAGAGKTVKFADIPLNQQSQYDLTITAASNPYKHASPEWIKFKSLELKGGTMSVQKYYTTAALTTEQKTATMQQIIDDGHVKLVTPEQKAVVAAQKAKYQQEQVLKQQEASKAAAEAQKQKYKMHFEQIKPADWHNDPKWSKVPGFKAPDTSTGKAEVMKSTQKALGLQFHSRSSSDAVSYYTGSGYTSINGGLRSSGYAALAPSTKNYVKKLDAMMEDTKGDAIMWRGVGKHGDDPKNVNNIPPPSEFVDMGFSSLSHNPNVSKNFSGQSAMTGKTTLFRVRVPKGSKAAFISRRETEAAAMNDEAEVITARGTRFKYISTTRDVQMEYSKVDIIEVEIVAHDGGMI